MNDTITVVSAHRRLAKLVHPNGTVDSYDLARTCNLETVRVEGLPDLARLLVRLLGCSTKAIVRGEIVDRTKTHRVRRLLYADSATGEQPTLRERPRRWVGMDFDNLGRPANVPTTDLYRCGQIAIESLPAAFHQSAAIVQATASHGIKPGLRLRLWFWLDRPTSGAELTRWLRGTPVDPAAFRPVQLIYTAAPVFLPGAVDPLPARMVLLQGAETVAVPSPESLMPPAPKPAAPLPRPGDTRAAKYAFAALAGETARVQRASEGNRHGEIKRAARSLARLVVAGLLTETEVRSALESSAISAGKPPGEADAVVTWALAHPSSVQLPEGIGQ